MRVIIPLLLLFHCISGSSAGASLREQVALLRREQWRDRERIRELERRREERDSPGEGMLLEVLEELSREIAEMMGEMGRLKSMEERMERGEEEMRLLKRQVEGVRKAQTNLTAEMATTEIPNNEKNKAIILNSWEGEGSGDLAEDDLFPAVTVKSTNHVTGEEVQDKTEKRLIQFWSEQMRHAKQLEGHFNRKISNLTDQLEKIERQTEIVQERCTALFENTTDEIHSSIALTDTLQDDLSNMWKRVSKVEFNSAQFQASLDVLTHDWTEDRKEIKSLQTHLISTQKEVHDQSNRILSVEMVSTNLTLQRCRVDSDITKRHLQVENVELRLSEVNHRMDDLLKRSDHKQKLNENIFRNYREALTTMARRTENVSRELSLLNSEHEIVRQNLNKFVKQLPKDCSRQTSSGVTLIHVQTLGPVEVYCDYKPQSGQWIVIQRRYNGTENFFRNWSDYTTGFGHLESEFWLGNEAIHLLTKDVRTKLHVDMWDMDDRYFYVRYEAFKVKSELEQYALEISDHSGNASDALSHHSGMGFSTFDRDNDASSANCALHHSGGWWYQHCHRVDLNGRYAFGMTWYDELTKDWLQLKRVEMKIAPEEFYS